MNSLVKKKDIELFIQQLKPHPRPKAWLEQYTIPADIAAEMLFIAGIMHKDIEGKTVVDLGCGTGRLALGAAIMGAKEVYGIDIDQLAVNVARKNQMTLKIDKVRINWIASKIECISGNFDTVIQNPPFGIKQKRADRTFIKKALDLASVVYSLHKHNPKNIGFIKRFVEKKGGIVTNLFRMNLRIPWTFNFHHKKSHIVKVDLYRMERN